VRDRVNAVILFIERLNNVEVDQFAFDRNTAKIKLEKSWFEI